MASDLFVCKQIPLGKDTKKPPSSLLPVKANSDVSWFIKGTTGRKIPSLPACSFPPPGYVNRARPGPRPQAPGPSACSKGMQNRQRQEPSFFSKKLCHLFLAVVLKPSSNWDCGLGEPGKSLLQKGTACLSNFIWVLEIEWEGFNVPIPLWMYKVRDHPCKVMNRNNKEQESQPAGRTETKYRFPWCRRSSPGQRIGGSGLME